MEVCKNKATGKYFIFLEQTMVGQALFVTPESKIKNLNMDLFKELEDEDENDLLSQNIITDRQAEMYHMHSSYRVRDKSFPFREYLEQLPLSERKKVIKEFLEELKKIRGNHGKT